MRNTLVAILLLTILTNSKPCHAIDYAILSDSAEFSLVTMGPGQEAVYTAFGHSGIRLRDPLNRFDMLFNYGIFHFNDPNFYLNYTKGKLHYELGVKPFKRSLRYYFAKNRDITEQVLNLTKAEKQELFSLLMINARPENKKYYYNYCYDNCATRIRDVLHQLLGDKITYDYSYASDSMSYRDLMDYYLGEQPWGDLGIDLCLGSEIDRTADGAAYMYMPEYLMTAFSKATINRGDSTVGLVSSTKTLNESAPMEEESSFIKPIHCTIFLFLIIGLMTHRGMKYGVDYKFLDYLLFSFTAILGVLLSLLWFGTDHLSKYNFNILWCLPLNFYVVYCLIAKQFSNTLKYYLIGYCCILSGLILFRSFMLQEIHLAFIPFVLALIIRSVYWINKTSRG